MALGVDSASNRNEYQAYFLEGKGGQYIGLTTLPPVRADFMNSGSLNILEPSRPVQGLLCFYEIYLEYFLMPFINILELSAYI